MKISFLIFLAFILSPSIGYAQFDTLWVKTYGGSNSEGGRSVCETIDGGFAIVGYTFSYRAGNADVYLIKIDSAGNKQWENTIGGAGWEYGYSICRSGDGGYILVGFTSPYGAGSEDVYVIKTDANGDTIWTRTYGGINVDVGRSVCQTNDGGYLICGYTKSFGAGKDDIYLLKINSDGDTLWTKVYGNTRMEVGRSVIETLDGKIVIAGAKSAP